MNQSPTTPAWVPMPLDTAHQSELWKLLKDAHPDIDPLELLDVMSEVMTYMAVGR